MKKLICLTLCLLAVLLSACRTAEKAQETGNTVLVDITVNGDGRYILMGYAVEHYDNGRLTEIDLTQPAILNYAVSSEWDNGVYVIKQTDGAETISSLDELAEQLRLRGDDEFAEIAESAAETINGGGPYTSVST